MSYYVPEFPAADYDRWKTTEPDYNEYEGDEEADEYDSYAEHDFDNDGYDEPYDEDFSDDFNDGEFW